MKHKRSTVIAAFAGLSLTGAASAAVIVAGGNGNFESTTISNQTFIVAGLYQGGLTALNGWTFSGGTNNTYRWLFADTDSDPNTSTNPYGPMLGTYSLNLTQANANYANVATTTVTGMTVGQNYTLSFDTAVRSGVSSASFTIKLNGTTLDTITQAVGQSYVTKSYSFTAGAESATLSFEYGNTVSTNGFMLDNVTVIPEPRAALLGGLGLLALLRRRR